MSDVFFFCVLTIFDVNSEVNVLERKVLNTNLSIGLNNIRPLVESVYQQIILLFLNQNICCVYSKEPSH